MATSNILSHATLNAQSIPIQLPWRYGSLDDFAAMAVLATLSVLYLLQGVVWDKPDPFRYKMFERPQENMMGGAKSSESTRDIAQKLDQNGADMVVFWGSQSGTCERLASRLSREIGQRFGKKALCADVSDCDPSSLAQIPGTKLAIFIVSTYGEGEPSDNMGEFWTWLQDNAAAVRTKSSTLSDLRYVALGLGNSNYKYYNAVVDTVVNKLNILGAKEVMQVGLADDARGETEEHYVEWKGNLFTYFKTSLGFDEHDPIYEPSILVHVEQRLEQDAPGLHTGRPFSPSKNRKTTRTMSPNHALPIRTARELFDDSTDRNCIHMEIDLSEQPGVKYKTGDHIGIWAENPAAEVDILICELGLQQRQQATIRVEELQSEAGKLKIPSPATLDALFRHYLEICAPVSRETVASLAQFAPTTNAQATLSELSTNKASYDKLLTTTYLNLGRLLRLLSQGHEAGFWSRLPLSWAIEVLPAMQPRYYSISSSSVVQPRQVGITAVVADKVLPNNKDERVSGLCTNYLLGQRRVHEKDVQKYGRRSSLNSPPYDGRRLFAHIRKSTFKLPALASQPIIMVGAGTGIAPFRGFLQERARLAKMGRPVGRTLLFFGCRNERQDFIYRDELQSLQAQLGPEVFRFVTAFSRPDDSGTKAYVQDCIREHSTEVCDLITNSQANVYICGSAAMARDVSKVVGESVKASQAWEEDELRSFMERQRRQRRWQQDVWG